MISSAGRFLLQRFWITLWLSKKISMSPTMPLQRHRSVAALWLHIRAKSPETNGWNVIIATHRETSNIILNVKASGTYSLLSTRRHIIPRKFGDSFQNDLQEVKRIRLPGKTYIRRSLSIAVRLFAHRDWPSPKRRLANSNRVASNGVVMFDH